MGGTRRRRRRTGTRSAWSTATRSSRSARCCSPSTRPRLSSTRRRTGRPTCSSSTTRCSSSRCTASRRRRQGPPLATLAGAGCALLTAHTNADRPPAASPRRWPGARADRPGAARPGGRATPLDKLTVFVPSDAAAPVRAALAEAGAGAIGDYDFASFTSQGEGRFRPLDGRGPDDRHGRRHRDRRRGADRGGPRPAPAARRSSPRCWPRTPTRSRRTTSSSSPTPARRPPAPAGSAPGGRDHSRVRRGRRRRAAGDRARRPRRRRPRPGGAEVAVCGGAGDFLLDRVPAIGRRRLRHQRPAAPPGGRVHREERPGAGRRRPLGGRVDLAARGRRRAWRRRSAKRTVDTRVSTLCTDPWTLCL